MDRLLSPTYRVEVAMMIEYRFALVDFAYPSGPGIIRLCEAGRTYPMQPAAAHAAAKRGLVATGRPPCWIRPSIFRQPEVLTETELAQAMAELNALEQHAAEAVQPAMYTDAYDRPI
jgi:hypothetical protein